MSKVKEDMVKVKMYKPENLNLEEKIKPDSLFLVEVRRNNGTSYWDVVNGKKLTKHIPAMYYFIHVLLERQHISFDTLRYRYDKTFVKMFARDIQPVKSKNYFNLIIHKLITLKVIELKTIRESNKYRNSADARYFRLTEEYSNAVVVQHEVIVRKNISDKLELKFGFKGNQSANEVNFKTIPAIYHQYHSVQKVRFDADGARKFAIQMYANNEISSGRLNTCMVYIYNISNKRFYYIYSDVCDRFFTTINGMPKELRQFVLDNDNNGLIELDFGSSTAYVVYKILSSDMPEHSTERDKILFEAELDLFKRMLDSGDFYSAFKKVVFPDKELDRDQTKNIVIKDWFNAKPNSKSKHKKQILKLFPRITSFMDSKKVPVYETFYNFVMLLESKLINEIIYHKFINLHPDAVIYTVFDSFLIEQKYSDELFEMMKNEGRLFYNTECVVKKKVTVNKEELRHAEVGK